MKKSHLLLLFFCSNWLFVFSQNDSLEQAILSYENKQFTLIQNGRAMLMEQIEVGNTEKVASLQHYLETQVENEDYLAFYDFEKWLLNVWTGQYYKILTEFRNMSKADDTYIPKRAIAPPPDLLVNKLMERLVADRGSIHQKLDSTNMAEADKGFLKLFTDWLVYTAKSSEVSASQLNQSSSDYLKAYPDSDFRYFIGNYINQEETLAKRGLDFEFFSGYGGYTSGVKSLFGHHVPIGVAFDFYYKKWIFGLRDHIGIGKIDQEIVLPKATWANSSKFNHLIFELSAAYELADTPRWKLFPFAGFTFQNISATDADIKKHPDYDNICLNSLGTPIFGLNLDFKLSSPYTSNPTWRDGYGILRLRAGFSPTDFSKKLDAASGNSFYVTLGVGGVARRVVKKYGEQSFRNANGKRTIF